MGATNPSKFHIELFVNDLAKPGASTFECLGDFEYNQNDCINLQCATANDRGVRQIPTDGLVLRGWYTTITLAVYGSMAKDGIGEQPISSPPTLVEQVPAVVSAQTSNAPIQVTNNVDSKVDQPVEIDWQHEEHDAKEFQKSTASNYYGGNSSRTEELNTGQQSTATQVSQSQKDASRQYTENWVVGGSNRAKSSESENWDCDDDVMKSNTISSPRSSRRSRSPSDARRSSKRDWSKSPEYRRRRSYDRGVLDKKLSKTRDYESSSARRTPPPPPPLPTGRMPRTPSPEIMQSPTVRRPRTPDSRHSDDFGKSKFHTKSVQSPQSTTDEGNIGDSTGHVVPLPPEPDEDIMSQGKKFKNFPCGNR